MSAIPVAIHRHDEFPLREELRLAGQFQRAVLPALPRLEFVDGHTCYLPHGSVSGDMYDFVVSREGDLAVFLGDATGHGVVSAFITMMVHLGLAGIRRDLPTDEVMRRLNRLLAGRTAASSISGVVFRITPDGRLTATHAGHPPLVVVPARAPGVIPFRDGGCPLGMFEDEQVGYVEEPFRLEVGDMVVAYTDGVTEWRRADGEAFGDARLARALLEEREESARRMAEGLLRRVRDFAGGAPCGDDLTLACFEYRGPHPLQPAR